MIVIDVSPGLEGERSSSNALARSQLGTRKVPEAELRVVAVSAVNTFLPSFGVES